MIKWLWYNFLKNHVKWGLLYYFKKITIHGSDNIPSGPVIFVANHQNALLDALVIACFNPHATYFLTRADLFRKPFVRWLLSTFKMLPIYRVRDGWQSLGENQKTFDACSQVFIKNDAVVIFPEGNHGHQRRIRPLSKGFTRLPFEALQKYPELKINIVPVGLNFSAHQSFRSSMSIYYGPPILANDYFKEPLQAEALRLRNDISECLKKLTTHIEDADRYEEIIQKLEATKPNYLDPIETNQLIFKIEKGEAVVRSSEKISTGLWNIKPINVFSKIINFLPLLLWKKIKKVIKDPVFEASIKFGFGIFAFPIYYSLLAAIAYLFWGGIGIVICLLVCIPSMAFGHRGSGD